MNDRPKRNTRLKHHADLNTSLAKAKFLNMTFLRKYFNLNKKIYKILAVKCKKQHKASELPINVNLNFQYKRTKLLSMIDQIRDICEDQLNVYFQTKQKCIVENIFKRVMFNDKRNENKTIKKKQTDDANLIFKHFTNNLIEQNTSKSQRDALTMFNFVNFAFSTSLLVILFN